MIYDLLLVLWHECAGSCYKVSQTLLFVLHTRALLCPPEYSHHICHLSIMAYKAKYKYELAMAAGVSSETFRKWLKTDSNELEAMGISPRQQLLTPKAVRYLCEKYDIDLE